MGAIALQEAIVMSFCFGMVTGCIVTLVAVWIFMNPKKFFKK